MSAEDFRDAEAQRLDAARTHFLAAPGVCALKVLAARRVCESLDPRGLSAARLYRARVLRRRPRAPLS